MAAVDAFSIDRPLWDSRVLHGNGPGDEDGEMR
jgi:hypothetical protein